MSKAKDDYEKSIFKMYLDKQERIAFKYVQELQEQNKCKDIQIQVTGRCLETTVNRIKELEESKKTKDFENMQKSSVIKDQKNQIKQLQEQLIKKDELIEEYSTQFVLDRTENFSNGAVLEVEIISSDPCYWYAYMIGRQYKVFSRYKDKYELFDAPGKLLNKKDCKILRVIR